MLWCVPPKTEAAFFVAAGDGLRHLPQAVRVCMEGANEAPVPLNCRVRHRDGRCRILHRRMHHRTHAGVQVHLPGVCMGMQRLSA